MSFKPSNHKKNSHLATGFEIGTLLNALWAEGGWKLKLTRVSAAEYEIYVTKYLLV